MKKITTTAALILFLCSSGMAQQSCRAGFYNLIKTGDIGMGNNGIVGNKITVSDTSTISSFKLISPNNNNGDFLKMALFSEDNAQSGRIGPLVAASDEQPLVNDTITFNPVYSQTILPGDYYLMFMGRFYSTGNQKHLEQNTSTNTTWYRDINYIHYPQWPGPMNPLDSLCCKEFHMWVELECCPRIGSMTASACKSYTSPSGKHTYTESGLYTDTILPQPFYNCDSIVVIDLSIPTFDTTLVSSGFTLTSPETSASYQWLNCDSGTVIPNATGSSYTDSTGGNFAVIMDKDGCTDTSACYNISGLGMNELDQKQLSVYPNPTTGEVYVSHQNSLEDLKMEVFSVQGKKLKCLTTKRNDELIISLPSQSGVYILHLTGDGKKETHRLVKY